VPGATGQMCRSSTEWIDWTPRAGPGWRNWPVPRDSSSWFETTWTGSHPSLYPDDVGAPIRPLDAGDADRMLQLVGATRPGPFRARTHELGPYVGVFHDDRLIAMAGERMHPPGFTEISAVCTHPDVRRRGLGAALTRHVAAAILERGETPFLHVAEGNDGARRIYEQLGFVTRKVVTVEILRSPA